MRLMNWNIEHMNSWWEGGTQEPPVMRSSFAGSSVSPAIAKVPELASRVAEVIKAIDPDIIAIQEGPGFPEIRHFLMEFVGGKWRVLRGQGGAQALLSVAREGRGISDFAEGVTTVGDIVLDAPFTADTNADLELEEVAFARVPQVSTFKAHGESFTLINNHLTSKFVNDGKSLFEAGGQDRLDYLSKSLIERRRISGGAYRLRAFVDQILEENPAAKIIVCGDLNDGPGSDFFEENFLTHSVVDRVFGSIFYREKQLTHVLLNGASTDYTAKFFDFIAGVEKELVIDHIGLSQGVTETFDWVGRVAVEEFEAQVLEDDGNLRQRDLMPSDHRPIVVDLSIS